EERPGRAGALPIVGYGGHYGRVRAPLGPPMWSFEPHVFEIDRLAVDPARRRRDPVRELRARDDRLHQARDVLLILPARQPLRLLRLPLGFAHEPPVRSDARRRTAADHAMEPAMRQAQLDIDSVTLDHLVPAVDATLAVGDVIVAEPLVQRHERRRVP